MTKKGSECYIECNNALEMWMLIQSFTVCFSGTHMAAMIFSEFSDRAPSNFVQDHDNRGKQSL